MELVIDFPADGKVTAMHDDRFPLSQFGKVSVARASDIRFNDSTQKWDIWWANGDEWVPPEALFSGFSTYEEARKAEVAFYNYAKMEGVEPYALPSVS